MEHQIYKKYDLPVINIQFLQFKSILRGQSYQIKDVVEKFNILTSLNSQSIEIFKLATIRLSA